MYLIMHNNRIYRFGIAYNRYVRYIFTALALMSISSFWYFTLYNFMQIKYAALMHSNNNLCQRIDLCKEQKKEYDTIGQHLQSLHKQINACYSSDKCTTPLRDRKISLVTRLHDAHLFLSGSTALKEIKKEGYKKQSITYDFNGSFLDILSFFSSLKAEKQLIQCKQLTLEKIGDNLLKAHCLIDYIELEKIV